MKDIKLIMESWRKFKEAKNDFPAEELRPEKVSESVISEQFGEIDTGFSTRSPRPTGMMAPDEPTLSAAKFYRGESTAGTFPRTRMFFSGAYHSIDSWPGLGNDFKSNAATIAIAHKDVLDVSKLNAVIKKYKAQGTQVKARTFSDEGSIEYVKGQGADIEGYSKVTLIVFYKRRMGAGGEVIDIPAEN
jgi:hypothetical protein